MRKIISKAEEKKKERKGRIIISVLLLSIMVLSVFGIIVDSIGKSEETSGNIIYNGIEFFSNQERLFFQIKGVDYTVLNSPNNLTNISIPNDLNAIEHYSDAPLYVYSKDRNLESQIYYNLNNFASRIQPGCVENEECYGDFPIKTCENNFILVLQGEEINITQEGNCVFIRSPKEEMQRVLDAFFLRITGVN